ncbi:MAG: hypothetical protein EXR71_15895 [Myxococcales bacterium]|nr:hypothetical protein [Myxococcales bacterium]
MSRRIPVLVVGGFLGSGKTTLVRHLLAEAQATGIRMAVVSNEFGELGIDAALLGAGDARMVELAGGCVCCTLSNELLETLQELRVRVDPDRIVIEASGLALPFDTQLHLFRPPVRDWVGDEACVVVVDAERAGESDPLFAEQLQSADLVLLNKLDLVDDAGRAAAEARIRALVDTAPIIGSVRGAVSAQLCFPSGPKRARHGHDHHDHPHHHDEWESAELHVPDGLTEAEAWSWIHARRGVRTKGFVRLRDGIRVVQGVAQRLELVVPDGEVAPELLGRVVVIQRRAQAWILAGGLSTRFGADKAMHPVAGETLLGRTARVCGDAGVAVTVVARHARPGRMPTLIEADGPRHPLWGVAAALAEAGARNQRAALVLPVDLPDLAAGALQKLLAGPAPIHASGQPLLALLPAHLAELAAAYARRGGSVRAFLDEAGSVAADVGPLANLNRPPTAAEP